MSSVSLKNVYKVYEGNVTAVSDFCMEIADKEFIVFVGPSGCGKSTTLRMIAGLEEISKGKIYIGDKLVNEVEPKDRNIAMVFQNYALYPHMSVYDNMAFGLKMRKVNKEEVDKKVRKAAEILDIVEYLDRKPKQLSGGQRQRVALGRAIVRDPAVFLLDEPLSNLDAKLRGQMRAEITKLHERLQTTFIYVTHDQVEAMTMGTRIVVMKDGFIQQIDTPENLYNNPINRFVASFIGTPQMNFFDVIAKQNGKNIVMTLTNGATLTVAAAELDRFDNKYFDGETPLIIGIRPENLHVEAEYVEQHKAVSFDGKVEVAEALGSETILYVSTESQDDDKIASSANVRLKVAPTLKRKLNDVVTMAFDMSKIHIFDKQTEKTIRM